MENKDPLEEIYEPFAQIVGKKFTLNYNEQAIVVYDEVRQEIAFYITKEDRKQPFHAPWKYNFSLGFDYFMPDVTPSKAYSVALKLARCAELLPYRDTPMKLRKQLLDVAECWLKIVGSVYKMPKTNTAFLKDFEREFSEKLKWRDGKAKILEGKIEGDTLNLKLYLEEVNGDTIIRTYDIQSEYENPGYVSDVGEVERSWYDHVKGTGCLSSEMHPFISEIRESETGNRIVPPVLTFAFANKIKIHEVAG